MSRTDDFIRAYKMLEKAAGNISELTEPTVFMYESTLCRYPDKLKLCRMVRNYIQHNEDYADFVAVTPAMITFLAHETARALEYTQKASDVMVRTKPLKETDIISESLSRLKNADFIPVVRDDRTVMGVFSARSLADMILAGLTKTSSFADMQNQLLKGIRIRFCPADRPVFDMIGQKYIVTDTGKRDGKYIGTVVLKNRKEES